MTMGLALNKKIIPLTTLLLLAALLLLSFSNAMSPYARTSIDNAANLTATTPCQQKTAGKQAVQLCQLKHLNSYTLIQRIFSFPGSLIQAAYFIFILGLISNSYQRR